MKKPAQYLIAGVPRRQAEVEMTIGIDLGDVWSHCRSLKRRDGLPVQRLSLRSHPSGISMKTSARL